MSYRPTGLTENTHKLILFYVVVALSVPFSHQILSLKVNGILIAVVEDCGGGSAVLPHFLYRGTVFHGLTAQVFFTCLLMSYDDSHTEPEDMGPIVLLFLLPLGNILYILI